MAEKKSEICQNCELKNAGLVTKSEVINVLKTVAFSKIDLDDLDNRDRMKALDMIVHMMGYDKPADDSTQALDTVLDKLGGEI